MGLDDIFIDVKEFPQDGYGLFQLMFITSVYGYILYTGSNMISDGSELLLLIPSMSGLIGSTVLPILGAVPDGLIVLFSGLGPDAQQQLDVGIGALAGSTVMLLTVPWFFCVIGGRVNINPNGSLNYYSLPKLSPSTNMSLFGTGVHVSSSANLSSVIMMITAVSYLIIEYSALVYRNSDSLIMAKEEHTYAVITFAISFGFFLIYVLYQYMYTSSSSDNTNFEDERTREGLKSGDLSLIAVVEGVLDLKNNPQRSSTPSTNKPYSDDVSKPTDRLISQSRSHEKKSNDRLKKILKPFFLKYANKSTETLSIDDLAVVLRDLGEPLNGTQAKKYFNEFDEDGSGTLDYEEFLRFAIRYTESHAAIMSMVRTESLSPRCKSPHLQIDNDNDENDEEGEEDEEEEEIPEDLISLSYEEQQKRIFWRSMYTMGLGTLLVVIFSDPMVSCLDELGKRLNISGFYVAFVLAPLASNASEVIASFKYAQKKTKSSMSISLTALLGAGIMNNTFVLAVFMLVLVTQGLYFRYFAETTSILVAEFAVALYALKSRHTVFDAFVILSFYPLTLLLVYSLYFLNLG